MNHQPEADNTASLSRPCQVAGWKEMSAETGVDHQIGSKRRNSRSSDALGPI